MWPSFGICEWYGTALGILFGLWLLVRLLTTIGHYLVTNIATFFLRHAGYPKIWSGIILLGGMSRFEVLLLTLYIASNGFCMAYRASSPSDVSSRAAVLSAINLIPLLVGSRLSPAADFLGLAQRTFILLHRWMGLLSALQGIIHTVLSVSNRATFRWDPSSLFGFISLGCMLFTVILCLQYLRRRQYEIFVRSHFTFAGLGTITLWKHLALQGKRSRFMIIAGLAMWCLLLSLRYVLSCYHISLSRGFPRTRVTPLLDATLLEIVDQRDWEPKAGQHIFLNMPRLSLTSIFQSHPFMIAWWDRGGDNTLRLYCLVQPRRGFTRRLAAQGAHDLITFISGPYGRPSHFEDYGTVLMFATGIGIAAQIPHLKDLFDCYDRAKARTRKIHLVWQTSSIDHKSWVMKWVDQILQLDSEFHLSLSFHVPNGQGHLATDLGTPYEEKRPRDVGTHNKIVELSEPADLESYVVDEIAGKRGSMIVSVSTNSVCRQRISKCVQHHMSEDVRLVELDYQED